VTETGAGCEPRRSRWLPVTVLSVFALVLVVDLVAVVLYRANLLPREEDVLELSFLPEGSSRGGQGGETIAVDPAASTAAPDGTVVTVGSDRGLVVRAPGELLVRFRVADAGSTLLMDYLFGRREKGVGCTLELARVASKWGTDTVWRRALDGGKQRKGRIRHYLADHVGWFELRIGVNGPTADVGFELTLPEISRVPPPRSAPHPLAAASLPPHRSE